MKKQILAATLSCVAFTAISALAPAASAQTRSEQQRWTTAERRFQTESALYERERQRYDQARARSGNRGPSGYNRGSRGYDERYVVQYDASRDYRDDARYSERRLSANDEVYRGSDGRYYCKRSDGTTGLIIGAAGGALLGNVIDGGSNRVGGTLIGGALGALLGKSVEQNQSEVRCR